MSNATLTASQKKFIKALSAGPQPVKPSQVKMVNALVAAGLAVWRRDLQSEPTLVDGRLMYLYVGSLVSLPV